MFVCFAFVSSVWFIPSNLFHYTDMISLNVAYGNSIILQNPSAVQVIVYLTCHKKDASLMLNSHEFPDKYVKKINIKKLSTFHSKRLKICTFNK